MATNPQKQAKSDSSDLGTAAVVGALAIGILLYDSIRRMIVLFAAPGAITVEAPIGAQTITADIGSGTDATVHAATLVVEDVNVVSIVSLVLAIVLSAACLIAAAVIAVLVCRRLLRGIVFDRLNTNLTAAISMLLLAAAIAEPAFTILGLNGVFAALGGDFDAQRVLFFKMAPLFFAAIAVGVLVIVFRRGTALQRETEGLV